MSEANATNRIDPLELLQEFDRIRQMPNEFEKNLELAQFCEEKASNHCIDRDWILRLYEEYCAEMAIPALARPLAKASRKLLTAQEALKNIALISIIASSISFFATQSEERTLFIQKQWELAESGPKIGSLRKSAIEALAARGFNLGKLQADNVFLAGLRLPRHTSLQGASLKSSNLYGATLIHSNLYFADFSRIPNGPHTNLENTNFSGSDLREARFRDAFMKKACLRGTNLEKAKFDGAVLTGADFRGARFLTANQLRNAKNAKQALFDPMIAKAIGAPIPAPPSRGEPASCRLPAMPSNLLTWLLNAMR